MYTTTSSSWRRKQPRERKTKLICWPELSKGGRQQCQQRVCVPHDMSCCLKCSRVSIKNERTTSYTHVRAAELTMLRRILPVLDCMMHTGQDSKTRMSEHCGWRRGTAFISRHRRVCRRRRRHSVHMICHQRSVCIASNDVSHQDRDWEVKRWRLASFDAACFQHHVVDVVEQL